MIIDGCLNREALSIVPKNLSCYTISVRRWLLLFLLTVLPVQFAAAAAAAYCLHETDISAKHVGHHEHKSPSSKISGDSTSDHTGGPTGPGDPDCEYCHLSCAQPLARVQPTWTGVEAHTRSWHESFSFGTRDPDVLDRPNWPLAA